MENNNNNCSINKVQMVVNGFMSTAIIYTACELDLFDIIKKNNRLSVYEIAEKINVNEQYLIRVFRLLDQYNLVNLTEYVEVTKEGELLTDDHPESLKDYALFCGRESVKGWMELYPAIKQNKSPYELLEDKEMFETLDKSADKFSTFNKMMSSVSKQLELTGVFEKVFSKNDCLEIVDVGGGTGTIIQKALEYYINSKGTIIDLAQARKDAEERLVQCGLSKRCSFQEGDFFKPIEKRGDLYILSRVLHDWDEEKAKLILNDVVSAMSSDSRLVVIDEVISQRSDSNALKGYICDIQMWVFCNGRERTYQEFVDLFDKAGLEIESVVDIDNGTSGLVCRKKDTAGDSFVMGEI